MDEQRRKLLRVAIFGGSFLIVVIGVGVGLAGSWFGWLIAAFGALDAITMPLVLRAIESRGVGSGGASDSPYAEPTGPVADAAGEAGGTATDPTADPSHNPYARED